MGIDWTMLKAIYEADDGSQYVIGISDLQATAGGFTPAPSSARITLPRGMQMRYAIGLNAGLGIKQRIWVNSQFNPIWTGSGDFFYHGELYLISARIGQKYPNRF